MFLSCQIKTDENMLWFEGSIKTLRLQALYFTKDKIQWARNQNKANASGIYFLFGPANEFPRRFYIGQAETRQEGNLGIVNRMNEANGHERILDWTIGVMFIYTDDYFNDNPMKLRYLENKLWNEAISLHPLDCQLPHTFQLVTRNEPRTGVVNEIDQETLDHFIIFCKMFLKLMNLPIYEKESSLLPSIIFNVPQKKDQIEQPTLNTSENTNIKNLYQSQESLNQISSTNETVPPLTFSSEEVQPPQESNITQIYKHIVRGVTKAQMYYSEKSQDYVLCKGSFLSAISSSAQDRDRMLRIQYSNLITPELRTKAEIHFPSRNQVALFVCGTATVNANVFWTSNTNIHTQSNSLFSSQQEATQSPLNSISTKQDTNQQYQNKKVLFFFKDPRGRYNAKGYLENNNKQFTILAGSKVIDEPPGDPGEGILSLRARYAQKLNKGIITENITFNSRSQAANFVCLRSSNGNICWKTENGISLGEIYP